MTTDIDAIDSFFEGDRDALSSWTDNLHGSEFDPDDVFADPRPVAAVGEPLMVQESADFGGGAERAVSSDHIAEFVRHDERAADHEDLWDLTFDDEKEVDVHPGLSLSHDPIDDFQVEVPDAGAVLHDLESGPGFEDSWEA